MTASTPPSTTIATTPTSGDDERDRHAAGNRGGRIGRLRRRRGPFLGGAVAIRGRMGKPSLAGRRRRSLVGGRVGGRVGGGTGRG